MGSGARARRAHGRNDEPVVMLESTWSLHPQLAQDTIPVGDLPLARVLLANDANYPWLILVPRLPGLVELIDLEENAQVQLLGEISAAARALKKVTACDKLNIAALGNQVAQLHVHVIARQHNDAAWPKPVWGVKPALAYAQGEQTKLQGLLCDALAPAGLNRRH
jgi:diadenosine tetraphosphate (Ap4A) HIT family hydrolase